MKYSIKSLDFAIDTLLPDIKVAKQLGAIFNRPSLLTMVAEDRFWKSQTDDNFNPSFKERMCELVVAEALRDIHTIGWMVPGDMELEETL